MIWSRVFSSTKAEALEMGYVMERRGAQAVNDKKRGPVWYWRPYSYEQLTKVQLKKCRPVAIMSSKEPKEHILNIWIPHAVQSIQM